VKLHFRENKKGTTCGGKKGVCRRTWDLVGGDEKKEKIKTIKGGKAKTREVHPRRRKHPNALYPYSLGRRKTGPEKNLIKWGEARKTVSPVQKGVYSGTRDFWGG